mmetsp:Transcript_61102/g.160660  ORF Transcript_61102/g.160660 Transcript_61102/m.160660 type:complete len:307 (+) Transcript_61102:94-1014(+)
MQRLGALCFLLAAAPAAGEGCWLMPNEGQECPFGSCCGDLKCENLLGSNGVKKCVRLHPQPQCVAEGQTCGGPGLGDQPCCGGMQCQRHLMGTHNLQCVKPQPPPNQCVAKGESCGCAGCQTLQCCGTNKCTESMGGGGQKFCLDSPWLATAAAAVQLRGAGRANVSNATAEAAAETLVQVSAPASDTLVQASSGSTSNSGNAATAEEKVDAAVAVAITNATEAMMGCSEDYGVMRTCGVQCFTSPSMQRSPCIEGCLHGKGLGSACASCLGQKADCSITHCISPCAASATGAECLGCVKSHCRSC